MAEVNYEGKLENGTVFDSSKKNGKPMEAVLGTTRFIKGWKKRCQA